MADVGRIIDTIIAAIERASSSRGGGEEAEKVYTDVPIARGAPQISTDMPEEYSEMRRIAVSEEGLSLGESALFVRQGRFMADFEDDFSERAFFMKYYPTYRQMSSRQLRTYFTWRSAVRRGEIAQTYLSYVYVYIYELINLIGCSSPEEARKKLLSFTEEYSRIDPSIKGFASRWANDMTIYYGIYEPSDAEKSRDAHICVFSDPAACSDDDFFDALCALSSYDPTRSKLYKKHPEEYKALVRMTFASFTEFCKRSRKLTLTERLFGRYGARRYILFPSAVFYDSKRREDREFVSLTGTRYVFRNGECTVEGYPEQRGKNSALGSLTKTVDSLLRPYFGLESTKPGAAVVTLGAIVKKEVDIYTEKKRREEAGKITIDFSVLEGIRASADKTRDLLVTEDETEDGAPEEAFPENAPLCEEERKEDGGDVTLTAEEREILRLILTGGDSAGRSRALGVPLSVAVDGINEKLFDKFFDNSIEFDGDAPVPVADYEKDLRGIAGI
ncbi:MAG: TerB N-terminal domain-containing protein [Clostridia bacterium]|nr:TerB N-terminal domain-containing protein [Clostridia bacterium]